MGKLGALTILIALAAVIYFLSPGSQVQVAKKQQTIETAQPEQAKNTQTKDTPPQNSQTQSTSPLNPSHDHEEHNANDKVEIPQYIKDSLDAKRIPASDLVEKKHADGSSSIDFKGQYQHVPVAVIGEDGKVTITETRIEPIADQ
jgi:hypothetical protein